MKRLVQALAALGLAALSQPAFAGADDFVLVNGTGAPVTNVAIRRATTNSWTSVPGAPQSGARTNIQFSDPDCAFDIKAKLAGIGDVVWTGINLCGTKAVILNRNGSGVLWVDYE